jgi:hypothetical protein
VLFDHFVCAVEQRGLQLKSNHLCRLEIDDQLELGGLQNWQIGRFRTPKNSSGVDADLTYALTELGRATVNSLLSIS